MHNISTLEQLKKVCIYTPQFIILHWDCNMHHARNICKGQDHFFKNFTFFSKKVFEISIIVAFLYMLYTVLTPFLNVGRAGKLFPWEQQKKPGQKRTRCTKSTAFFCYFCQHHYVRGTFIHSALLLFQFIAYLSLNKIDKKSRYMSLNWHIS